MSTPRHFRPPKYALASVAISLAGLFNGYDTGSIGAMTTMAQFEAVIGRLSPTLLGFTVSLVMLAGVVPSFFAGYLAERFGRLRVILCGSVLVILGAVLQGSANSLPQFLVGRAFSGCGQGIFLSNVSVYICEVAPAKHRGMLVGLPQFQAATGVCLGYFTCYGSVKLSGSIAWRLPLALQSVVGAALTLSCLVLPESPRWLIQHGKTQQARRSLQKLEFDMAEAERDFLTSTQERVSLSLWQSLAMLFKRGYRARTMLALFILGMVQLSGIDGVIYYAPTLFSQAGLTSSTASFLASGVSAILMLVISIPAFLFADKWGRRISAISGGITLSACMFLIGSLYAANAVHPSGVARWVVIVSVYIFSLTYCATWGIVGKIYASEIQPGHTRAAANSVAQALSFFTNWIVAILTPILLKRSAYSAYFLFGGLALVTVTVLVLYMPETRGRSLENIQEAFHRPTVISDVTSWIRRRGQAIVESPEPIQLTNRSLTNHSASSVARPRRIEATK
ncbi:uncharacterized protein TrAtP1_000045 [Trichoderma atroviride]|uniref:Major facilitator superfamily (MFS) profile domain-containing protein n=1 Tax=Hypocrea atroviridis (strain ATCC 20476 / IMI 206040) TaxID=452589 RepID=G9NKA2_HYPAI|nr:uncharacterized protein TRIATDRAFT_92394 [Trichoderma atroviride IMI 206040]EHK49320.1 hypothetical protein TRIATDRAFT_92394 [Trichoderma atroviride IMI 206040]UKZ58719.1 hypothetical protein TrAtP1_000045 [Trichoderma atroviride]